MFLGFGMQPGVASNENSAAVALEKAVNGTSLMLVFQVGDLYLLFPGDAQWGTWKEAMNDAHWKEILKKTTFYKVGHHASHNATPVEFVETTLGNDFWAMASTSKLAIWPLIPKVELLIALEGRLKAEVRGQGRIIRSDDLPTPTAGSAVTVDTTNRVVELKLPVN